MLAQRRRRWANVKPALVLRLLYSARCFQGYVGRLVPPNVNQYCTAKYMHDQMFF